MSKRGILVGFMDLFLISPAAFESHWRASVPVLAGERDPRFVLPEYDAALASVLIDLVEYCATEVAPILRELPTKRASTVTATHVAGPEGETISFKPFAASHSWSIDVRHVVDFDFGEWSRAVLALAEQHADAAIDHLLGMATVVTKALGNVASAKGEPFGWPLILRGLALVEIDFDATGNPLLPKLVDSARKRHVIDYPPMSDDQRIEFDALMMRKRGEFDARTHRR